MLELQSDTTTVIPLDFSEACTSALKDLLNQDNQSTIHLVHVTTGVIYTAAGEMMPAPAMVNEDRQDQIRQQAEKFLAEHSWSRYPFKLLVGDPGTEVVEYAQQVNADLIVVPSHGYHGWKRLMLGSVAERIVRMASCPVLVLRRADAD